MHEAYDVWPEISKEAYESDYSPIEFSKINHIIFSGMGGSGTVGDIFSSILSKTKIHVSVIKGYSLPNTVDSNTLIITTSVSGNTSETLSILDSARKKSNKIIAFSSGGKMEKYCIKNNIEFRKIPQVHSPRASLTKITYSMLKILDNIIPIKKVDIEESFQQMRKIRDQICSDNLTSENPSLNLAEWISYIPMIYYPGGLQSAAIRFKNSLQENAKRHAMIEEIIESSHNGIVAWEKPSKIQPILLKGKDDHIKTKKRWKILKKYFNENNIKYREVSTVNGNILSKIINLIYLLDYCSIYHAILNKTDPSPVRSIEYIKNKM